MPTLTRDRLRRHRSFDAIVGSNIRVLRARREINQNDLADLADMPKSQLSRVENGLRSLKFREAVAIGRALHVDPRELTWETR